MFSSQPAVGVNSHKAIGGTPGPLEVSSCLGGGGSECVPGPGGHYTLVLPFSPWPAMPVYGFCPCHLLHHCPRAGLPQWSQQWNSHTPPSTCCPPCLQISHLPSATMRTAKGKSATNQTLNSFGASCQLKKVPLSTALLPVHKLWRPRSFFLGLVGLLVGCFRF